MLLALLGAIAVLPMSALAEGSDPHAKAYFLGKVQPTGKNATRGLSARLRVHYRCSRGDALWVSVKQAPSRLKDPALTEEGSSAASAAWLQSHRNRFVCNGKPQTGTFSVDKVEYGFGKLKSGWTWVQFCVTKGDDLTLSESAWVFSRS
jgi:hypothetical protein